MALKESGSRASLKISSLFPLVGIFLLFFLLNPSIISDLRTYSFDDGTYSHAYLIPFVIAFLYWRAFKQQQLILEWNTQYFIVFVLILIILLLLQIAQQNVMSRLATPLVIILALTSVYRANSSVIIPASLLWFITPVWGVLNGFLQYLSVVAVSHIMQQTSIPTFVDGNFVHIPSGVFEIADGCSGLRYFIVSVALSAIFSFLNLKSVRSVLLFFVVAILGSLLTNWIRIVLLIIIGHQTEMQSPLMDDHNVFGWYLYIPFIVLLFYFGSLLDRDKALIPPPAMNSQVPVRPQHLAMMLGALSLFSTFTLNLATASPRLYPAYALDLTAQLQSKSFDVISPRIFIADNLSHRRIEYGSSLAYQQHYEFAGFDDARRANFYLNNVIPEHWGLIKKVAHKDGALLWVKSSSPEYGLIYFSYKFNNKITASEKKLRLYRLQGALQLSRKTELNWYFIYCKNQACSEEQQVISELSNLQHHRL